MKWAWLHVHIERAKAWSMPKLWSDNNEITRNNVPIGWNDK